VGALHFIKVHLQLHQLVFFRFDHFRQLSDIILRLLLISLKLRLHLECFPLFFEEVIVCLREKLLHLV